MFVINSNNQKNTTNYMLADPGYPNLDSILMFGAPTKVIGAGLDNTDTTTGNINITTTSFPTLDMAGTERINYFCPKINKESLYSGIQLRNPLKNLLECEYIPDIGYFGPKQASSASSNFAKRFQVKYNIAVKGLTAGKIIGEKIIAPLQVGIMLSYGGEVKLGYYNYSDFYSYGKILSIQFRLYNQTDGRRDIATLNYSSPMNTFDQLYSQSVNTKYITTSGASGTHSMSVLGGGGINTYRHFDFYQSYSGSGVVSADGDMLIATVDLGLAYYNTNNSGNTTNSCFGIYAGGTNNNSMRDVYGFRPFQVSIRDA